MALLIVLQIAAAVLAIFYYPLIDEFLVERFEDYKPIPKAEDFNNTILPDPDDLIDSGVVDDLFNTEFVDVLQTTFDCCGWNSQEDFTVTSKKQIFFQLKNIKNRSTSGLLLPKPEHNNYPF